MIVRIRGPVLELGEGRLVVDCGGVGYEVHAPESVVVGCGGVGDDVDLYVRQIVREDDISLYGFLSPSSRRLFDLLREVKGCGARISLSVLGSLGESAATAALSAQDSRTLTRAPGVGPKLAERMILELKDKVAALPTSIPVAVPTPAKPIDEVVEALMSLGYRRSEAEAAAEEARQEGGDAQSQIVSSLRRLQR
jgi:holliday junction DNA helicase RuvA